MVLELVEIQLSLALTKQITVAYWLRLVSLRDRFWDNWCAGILLEKTLVSVKEAKLSRGRSCTVTQIPTEA